jgi:GxxExxY protein
VVEGQVIIELKAVDELSGIHEAQLLNYLKATGYKMGLLVAGVSSVRALKCVFH